MLLPVTLLCGSPVGLGVEQQQALFAELTLVTEDVPAQRAMFDVSIMRGRLLSTVL